METTQDDMIRAAYEAGAEAGRDAEWDLDAAFEVWKFAEAGDLAIIAVPECALCGGTGEDPWADYVTEEGADGGPYEHPDYCRACEGDKRVSAERFRAWLTDELFRHGQECIAATMEDEGRAALGAVIGGLMVLGQQVEPSVRLTDDAVGYGRGLTAASDVVCDLLELSEAQHL